MALKPRPHWTFLSREIAPRAQNPRPCRRTDSRMERQAGTTVLPSPPLCASWLQLAPFRRELRAVVFFLFFSVRVSRHVFVIWLACFLRELAKVKKASLSPLVCERTACTRGLLPYAERMCVLTSLFFAMRLFFCLSLLSFVKLPVLCVRNTPWFQSTVLLRAGSFSPAVP